ncbi:MAG: ABC transporter ATP-binding protein [Deltaproteobacteria bacterium]|nr:ABC transporter ATP-binding protein [Deltaproteobacteria bacterium]MBW2068911.1 ABC transporter ATP-binding protein [Deltaproteobacteria bacterium]
MILKIDGIAFSYNSHPVLDSVSFSIRPGEMVALCGVNGAGKSTLLRCILALLNPTNGAVLIGDQNVRNMKTAERAQKMAWVPQKSPEMELTVFDVVLLGRLPHGSSRPRLEDMKVVERVLDMLNLSHLSTRPMRTLSGGEAQKVIIARALATLPRVLLCDEPTSHLDMKNQLDVMKLLNRVTISQKLATLVAIHDVNLAVRFCSRLLFLKDGRIFAALRPEELSEDVIEAVYGVKVSIVEGSEGRPLCIVPV